MAGSGPRSALEVLRAAVEDTRVAVLAPASGERTWDVIAGGFVPDVAAIAALLQEAFAAMPVDASRLAIAGHSDGASYALSLGLTNGDLFTHIVAFSPGFAAPGPRRGRPRIFASHGVEDAVLPIDRTSRRLVPALRRAGHRVDYREFPGGHAVPAEIARDALRWFLAS
jgi:phospholipase/carboxylesterase